MSNVYSSTRTEQNSKPACYADPDHFNEYGTDCSLCPARVSCEAQIVNLHSAPTHNVPHMPKRLEHKKEEGEKKKMVWRNTNTPYRTSTTQQKVVSKPASQMMRPVKFNLDKPVVKQYVTYVAFDAAESATTRATELIQQMRTSYEEDLNSESDD